MADRLGREGRAESPRSLLSSPFVLSFLTSLSLTLSIHFFQWVSHFLSQSPPPCPSLSSHFLLADTSCPAQTHLVFRLRTAATHALLRPSPQAQTDHAPQSEKIHGDEFLSPSLSTMTHSQLYYFHFPDEHTGRGPNSLKSACFKTNIWALCQDLPQPSLMPLLLRNSCQGRVRETIRLGHVMNFHLE